jgi:hypothetical protein
MTEACNIIAALDRAAQNWLEIELLVNSAQGDKTGMTRKGKNNKMDNQHHDCCCCCHLKRPAVKQLMQMQPTSRRLSLSPW